jgi:hypothetical protein
MADGPLSPQKIEFFEFRAETTNLAKVKEVLWRAICLQIFSVGVAGNSREANPPP